MVPDQVTSVDILPDSQVIVISENSGTYHLNYSKYFCYCFVIVIVAYAKCDWFYFGFFIAMQLERPIYIGDCDNGDEDEILFLRVNQSSKRKINVLIFILKYNIAFLYTFF